MARNDGIDRTSVRNVNLTNTQITNTQRHNEREKESYTNPDIIPERAAFNVHFKAPTDGYKEMFAQMQTDKITYDEIDQMGRKTLLGRIEFTDLNAIRQRMS